MQQLIIEAQYPLIFRKEESKALGEHIKKRHSVVLIGMKRVGISNFLRFFLYHGGIKKIYIQDGKQHFFIPVDLNDLVEREVSFFWTLTLKRIVDEIEKSALPQEAKNGVKRLFLDSMKSQDLFLTIDSVRKALVMLSEAGVEPTLFFIRFDRIKDALNPEFFANLEGLRDATHQKLAYIFTSFRRLNQLSPTVFGKAALSLFSNDLYIKPAKKEDVATIYKAYEDHYKLLLVPSLEQGLFDIVDGYVQYLQLALIVLHEQKPKLESKSQLFDYLVQDERIILQSEELWESLDSNEQEVLNKINRGEEINAEEKEKASYLWETGFIAESNGKRAIFNALFDFYVKQKTQSQTETNGVEFTKKENLLFIFLKDHLNEVCEREQIIEAVWPEVEALGVSDWAIDRLVARARSKLNKQGNKFEIQT
ncbi:MAG: helix-turn-helix domain-containing protein, partial [Candidatus Levybacteria bacterium]|nr:helix-turn-helix domain-containing protein [Candidatus Levybacteria bacterium]